MATEIFFFCIYIKIQFSSGTLTSDTCHATWDKSGSTTEMRKRRELETRPTECPSSITSLLLRNNINY